MIDDHSTDPQMPLRLTSKQSDVLGMLRPLGTERYPLGDWYLGALYAVANPHNPDRFSQAAQSLRELMEKFPLVPRVAQRMATIQYQKLTRREKSLKAVEQMDPLYNRFGAKIREEKRGKFYELWKVFQSIAHHKPFSDSDKFNQYIEELEDIILDILAPITAQNQRAIQSILDLQHRTRDDTERLFSLIERTGANYTFFFNQVSDPSWIDDLNERGYFSAPPGVERLSEEQVSLPYWAPIKYLNRIAEQDTPAVIDTILNIGKVDNPRILHEIVEIALKVRPIEQSLKLKRYVFQFIDSHHPFFQGVVIPKLIARWGGASNDGTKAALGIVRKVIAFQSDPEMEEKKVRYEKNLDDWMAMLSPTPKFESWVYQEIFEKGVRIFAEREPFRVACFLIDAVANMVTLRQHLTKSIDGEDGSEYWCRRLNKSNSNYIDSKEILVHTLTFACEKVFGNLPNFIVELNTKLIHQRWKIFKRLQNHLYALHPNEQTKPWILELILSHPDYAEWEHHYEFQQMVRNACEHFGESLLTKEERTKIFDAIMGGPSKSTFRDWMDDRFTEELFQKHQKKFHQKQFRPFSTVLFGKYVTYYYQLDTKLNEPISDEDYSPVGEIRGMSYHSPKSPRDLANLYDNELLDYINEWQGEHDIELDWTRGVSIRALSGAFQKVFMEAIIPNKNRLNFWLRNRDRIQRPVYIRAMIDAMQENVKAKKFEKIDCWLDFCQWVLSHPDAKTTDIFPFGDESCEEPNWTTSRRSIVDFIKTCLDKNVNAPISVRSGLASLLQTLCTQSDWTLDQEKRVFRDDLVDAAIKRTRGRALESLVYDFGYWVRRHDSDSNVPEIATILDSRLSQNATLPLTLPEYAILGFHYLDIAFLNPVWTEKRKVDIFPHGDFPAWRAAFSAVIKYVYAEDKLYRHLQDEYRFAIEHLDKFPPTEHEYGVGIMNLEELIPNPQERESRRNEIIDKLGHHLFIYYLLDMFPPKGSESMLNLFYEKTKNNQKHWKNLFGDAGCLLKIYGKAWESNMITRAKKFFDWRFSEQNSEELQGFFYWWIDAECLTSKWRLDAFSRVLGICQPGVRRVMHGVSALVEMLDEHPEKVLECFAKMTDLLPADDHVYIDTDKAKTILKFGLNSANQDTRRHAEHARENLLRHGYFDFLQLDGQ